MYIKAILYINLKLKKHPKAFLHTNLFNINAL